VRVSFFGHDLHGLAFGPDGKLYFSIGDRGMNVLTPDGRLEAPECGSVVRCQPDGSELEIVHTGLRNPQELAFDEFGNLFTGDNNSDSGDKARIVQIIDGGETGWRMPYQYLESPVSRGAWNENGLWKPRHDGQPAYIVPPIANFTDGPSGLTYSPGVGLPANLARTFFLADFRGGTGISGVRRFQLTPDGATFKLGDNDIFLWQLVVTDVEFGYDGAMYLLDWVEGWTKPNRGRIYRLYHPDYRSQGADTARLMAQGINGLDTPALGNLLAHADQRVRLRAQFALATRPESADLLAQIALVHTNQLARLHAIWATGQLARKDAKFFSAIADLSTDSDAEVRAQWCKTAGDARIATAVDRLIARLQDDSPRVRMYAALALGRLRAKSAVPALFAVLEQNADADTYLRHGGVYALAQIGDRPAIENIAAGPASLPLQRAALLVLRRWASPLCANFLKHPDPNIVQEAALAIYDLPIADALPQLAEVAPRVDLPMSARRRAVAALWRLGEADHARSVADIAGNGRESTEVRRLALDALAQWAEPPELDPVVGAYRPIEKRSPEIAANEFSRVAASLLASTDKDLRQQTIELAGRFGTRAVESQIVEIFNNPKEQAKVRADALAALGAMNVDDLSVLIQKGLADERQTVRTEARKLLARLEPDKASRVLADVLESGTLEEKQQSLATLAAMKSEIADTILANWLTRLQQGRVEPALRLDLRMAATSRSAGNVADLAKSIESARSNQSDPVVRYEDALEGGNADRGSKVFFEKTSAACLRCHKVGDRGGEVGPNLSKIAQTRDARSLLEAIVDPNRKIAEGFDSVVLLLDDGKVVTGVLKEENEREVVVMDAEANRIVVPKESIDERQKGKSAMPDDAAGKLTEAEIRDLVAYLATLK
jgi:quinoprotein glucose dehydrogenase